MLTPDHLKVAIVMINRAPCKGEEARDVAITLQALGDLYEQATAAMAASAENEETSDDDDAGTD